MSLRVGKLTEQEAASESLRASATVNYWRALRGALSEEDEAIRDQASLIRIYNSTSPQAKWYQCTVPAYMVNAEKRERPYTRQMVEQGCIAKFVSATIKVESL